MWMRQAGAYCVRKANSHGARPVCQTISMIKWLQTSRLSRKNSLCGRLVLLVFGLQMAFLSVALLFSTPIRRGLVALCAGLAVAGFGMSLGAYCHRAFGEHPWVSVLALLTRIDFI